MRLSDEVRGGYVRPETLREIGERLDAHIRLEERELFPMIEESLSEVALGELGSRLMVKEAGPHAEPWVPSEGLSFGPWPGPGDSEEAAGTDRPATGSATAPARYARTKPIYRRGSRVPGSRDDRERRGTPRPRQLRCLPARAVVPRPLPPRRGARRR